MDRVQARTDPLSRQESYYYDLGGNLISATDRRGKVTTPQYDGLNRRTFVGYGTTTGPSYKSTSSYNYDGGNRLTSVVDSASGTITPVFDNLDRLTSETTPQGSISYTYDNAGRRASTTVATQPPISYTYDTANRLTQITQGTSSTTFAYDVGNRRTTMTLPNGVVATYGYDTDSRLTSMSYQMGSTTLANLTYAYDATSRRTQVGGSFAGTGFPQAVSSAVYDVNNELTQWNGTPISYDANGNLTSDGVASYTWNARNQLSGRGAVTYQYDGYGRRTRNAAGTSLLYDGADAAQELSGTTAVANRLMGGVDEFFSRTDGSGTYTPITDALGSVRALADSSGNLVTQYIYDPFGSTMTSGTTSSNTFQYTGRENDGNGIYYYRARYYSPSLGRFVSEDPVGFNGGSTNLYSYAGNSPTNLRDPSGQNPACLVGGLLGTIGYNSYVIYQSLAGRKANYYAGLSGLGNILSGNAQAFGAGCLAGSLIAPLGFAVPANAGVVYGARVQPKLQLTRLWPRVECTPSHSEHDQRPNC